MKAPAWLAAARAAAQQPPQAPRQPLHLAGRHIGSLRPEAAALIAGAGVALRPQGAALDLAVPLAEASAALDAIAQHLRRLARTGPWRGEQLAVRDLASGERIASVERGLVRVLGVPTEAVHLIATAPCGAHWVQQRAFNKAQNPGQWDTLMGGMVSDGDDLAAALARETWEEAGLGLPQLQQLRYGGHADFALPSREGGGLGYMQERIHWYAATLPAGLQPHNQDGEVAQFALLPEADLHTRLAEGAFTPEAALVLAQYFGW